MISRQWRGLAKRLHAEAYVEHLRKETFPDIARIPGFVSASILRRDVDNGVEFLIVTEWQSLDAIRKFAGADPEAAVVPQKVQAMMIEYDRRVRHYEMADVPALYEWLGGMPALERLTTRFYERVKDDAILAPIFAHMGADHPRHVALFLAEVLGGPATYSQQHGGHPHMIRRHLNRHLTQAQRRQWVGLLLDTADEIGMPDDPEFRSALVGYLEWGSRLAVLNSQDGAKVEEDAPMPKWGWGAVKGPYKG